MMDEGKKNVNIQSLLLSLGATLEHSEALMEYIERPPERNCSCHISPPCDDCVNNSHIREAIEGIESSRKEYNALLAELAKTEVGG